MSPKCYTRCITLHTLMWTTDGRKFIEIQKGSTVGSSDHGVDPYASRTYGLNGRNLTVTVEIVRKHISVPKLIADKYFILITSLVTISKLIYRPKSNKSKLLIIYLTAMLFRLKCIILIFIK